MDDHDVGSLLTEYSAGRSHQTPHPITPSTWQPEWHDLDTVRPDPHDTRGKNRHLVPSSRKRPGLAFENSAIIPAVDSGDVSDTHMDQRSSSVVDSFSTLISRWYAAMTESGSPEATKFPWSSRMHCVERSLIDCKA